MASKRSYSDEQLLEAIHGSDSWRKTLRALGLSGTSAGVISSVRKRADELGIDYSHFRGQRKWSEESLQLAIRNSSTWDEAVTSLGLDSSNIALVKGHARRLSIASVHLEKKRSAPAVFDLEASSSNLSRAGSLLAATWFTLAGATISWPLEPARYDLIAEYGDRMRRVQVKTTITQVGTSWQAFLSTSGKSRRVYDVDEIDEFFVVDGDLNCYLIPVSAVGGLHAISLNAYEEFRLPQFGREGDRVSKLL